MFKPATKVIINALNEFGIECPKSIDLEQCKGHLVNDSRMVVAGDVFCAIIGHDQDGRSYINQAISNGAKLVLADCEDAEKHGNISKVNNVSVIDFFQLNQQLFRLAQGYYQNPQADMTMIGITGTNGKTTTSQLIAQMLSAYNKPCAVIGTNGAGRINALQPIENTTPSASELHQLFYRFKHEQLSHVAMEVSSHALIQNRVTGAIFDIAVFTNLSRDHLDYHGTMAHYAEAKKMLFTGDEKQQVVLNFDDEQVKEWLSADVDDNAEYLSGHDLINNITAENSWLYGQDKAIFKMKKFVCAQEVKHHHEGVTFKLVSHLGDAVIESPLLGNFNIENLLAAITVLLIEGADLKEVSELVKQVKAVAGRMETTSEQGFPTSVVDYAHTPDALEKALKACRQHCHGDLYVVFGCGGDRDKGKRPLMAQAAQKYADHIVITNDNPRSENALQIAEDILVGFNKETFNLSPEKISVVLDRRQAVLQTLTKASAQDIVLLAGKGHEDYILFSDEQGDIKKLSYDERAVVESFYQGKSQGKQAFTNVNEVIL